ncbi:MAG: hypothetical protein L0332_18145 [Chloroflexi bacterium]|nr:hypothetical protein [Chloroflexota bacterium]MCI0575129.1 hypothetical protein [Chloroflexota bacterium]MCI0646278.1 hypothetical protein [Chloroflexota bacterium]MCI0728623.1 hypothetical protein [Chloroflexota bacterium]
MSLGDHLRYLRAVAGGLEPNEIAAEIGLERPSLITQVEQRYRTIGDEELIRQLADYFDRPVEELLWHQARPRKHLTFYVARAWQTKEIVSLTLRTGEMLSGQVAWWDLGSVGLRMPDGRLLVVQRHAVVDWPGATETRWKD